MGRLRVLIPFLLFLTQCATSPLDRRQVVLYSDAEMARQGEQAYSQMQSEMPTTPNSSESVYVQCVADYIIEALAEPMRSSLAWEVTVFDNEQANAFALPGGKIGVYNGLLDVAFNQHQLAAVMAHEVGHVLANHSNERASQSTLRNVGLTAARVLGASDVTIEAIDYGTQLGLFLPFNRTQESEADGIGIILMAEAGFRSRVSPCGKTWRRRADRAHQNSSPLTHPLSPAWPICVPDCPKLEQQGPLRWTGEWCQTVFLVLSTSNSQSPFLFTVSFLYLDQPPSASIFANRGDAYCPGLAIGH